MKSVNHVAFLFVFTFFQVSLVYAQAQNLDQFIKKDTRVVLLGDPSHGEGNVFEYRAQLIKELVEKHGFNTVGFESGTYFLNSDLLAPNTAIRKTLRENVLSIYSEAQQFQGTINYIAEKKLNFFGFDFQHSSEFNALEKVIAGWASDCLSDEQNDTLSKILQLIEQDSGFKAIHHKELDEIISHLLINCTDVTNDLFLVQLHYLSNIKELLRWKVAIDSDNLTEQNWEASFTNIRDSMMAVNVLKYLKNHPTRKLILIGANGHFANKIKLLDLEADNLFVPMGRRLKKSLNGQVVSFGTIALGGAYGSINKLDQIIRTPRESYEWVLREADFTDSIVIIKGSDLPKKCRLSTILDYRMVNGDWTKVFDNYIVFNEYEPVEKVDWPSTEKDSTPAMTANEVIAAFGGKLNYVAIDTVNVVAPKRRPALQYFTKILIDKIENNATVGSEQKFRFYTEGFINDQQVFTVKGKLDVDYPIGYLDQKAKETMYVESYTEIPTNYYDENSLIQYDHRLSAYYNKFVDSTKKISIGIVKDNDLLKSAPVFQNPKKLSRYNFFFLYGTEDTLVIEFKAKKPNYKSTGLRNINSYSGVVKVLRKHNSIAEIVIYAERDPEQIKNIGKTTFKKLSTAHKYTIDSELFKIKSVYGWNKVDCIYQFVSGESNYLSEGKLDKTTEKVIINSTIAVKEVR